MNARKWYWFFLSAALLLASLGSVQAATRDARDTWGHALDRQKNIAVSFSIPLESEEKIIGDRTIFQEGELVIAARHQFAYQPNSYQVTWYCDPLVLSVGFFADEKTAYYEVVDQNFDVSLQHNGIDIQYNYSFEIDAHRRDGSIERLGWFHRSWIHNGESPDSAG